MASYPQILSRKSVKELVGTLDATSSLEVYQLRRHALLLENITIAKTAIGFRSSPHKREFTLEFGPQRIGPDLRQEAIPTLFPYVSWQNEAHVYYETSLQEEEWDSADYMASITGTVLDKILQVALLYPRKRYQPFVVYNTENHLVLKSSSSLDFTLYIWQSLANLGVVIKPILSPPRMEVRLHVDEIQKVSSGDYIMMEDDDDDDDDTYNKNKNVTVSTLAFDFFSKLQSCVTAMATGNYTLYDNNEKLLSNTPTAITNTIIPSMAPSMAPSNSSNSGNSNSRSRTNPNDDNKDDDDVEDENGDEATTNEEDNDTKDNDDALLRRQLGARQQRQKQQRGLEEEDGDANDTSNNEEPIMEDDMTMDADDTATTEISTTAEVAAPVPSNATTTTLAPTTTPNTEAQEASEAAAVAKEAAAQAKEAAKTVEDSKAANAAEVAANAAQKAADATWQKDKEILQKNLLSGDGSAIATSVVECFTNPQYGLKGENRTTTAYLYLDGATYYRLQLISPYMDVQKVDLPMPQPPFLHWQNTIGGDFSDWVLLLVMVAFFVLGLVLTLQRSCGLIRFSPLYKMQKRFFSPDSDGYDSDEDNALGQGFVHAFGEDVIPLSMGGRRPMTAATTIGVKQREQVAPVTSSTDSKLYQDEGHRPGDVELKPYPFGLSGTDDSTTGSRPGLINMAVMDRLQKDPDLVDLPNLSSSSKVAVPVSIERQRHLSRTRSLDLDFGDLNDDLDDSNL